MDYLSSRVFQLDDMKIIYISFTCLCGHIFLLSLDILLCFISTVNLNSGISFILVSYCSNETI